MVKISHTTLDAICPMHVAVSAEGRILHAGPTLRKLRSRDAIQGRPFFDVFQVQRPRTIGTVDALLAAQRRKLHLSFRDAPHTALKGVLVCEDASAGAIIDLSFGISILDGVRDYELTSADFAATDLAIEMLYLVEAKSAAMESSRKLNAKLQSAMILAEEQAYTDTLTGLKNRRALDHLLEQLIEMRQKFALMHLELDFFKAVNDTLGHAAGDHVLREVAHIMTDETREDDIVARVGGDEFVLVLPALVRADRVAEVAERLIRRISVPIPFNGQKCQISSSVGIVVATDFATPNAEDLMDCADVALYASKHRGRAQFHFYSEDLRTTDAFLTPPSGRAAAG